MGIWRSCLIKICLKCSPRSPSWWENVWREERTLSLFLWSHSSDSDIGPPASPGEGGKGENSEGTLRCFNLGRGFSRVTKWMFKKQRKNPKINVKRKFVSVTIHSCQKDMCLAEAGISTHQEVGPRNKWLSSQLFNVQENWGPKKGETCNKSSLEMCPVLTPELKQFKTDESSILGWDGRSPQITHTSQSQ